MDDLLCAIDVGTASARAGIFDSSGRMIAKAVHPIALHRGSASEASYASEEIWRAAGAAAREAVAVTPALAAGSGRVAALGFDATCSLVLRDRDGTPLPLGPNAADTIAWFDHRAAAQAARCTATGHAVLDHLGGSMSPEMQIPKLMWLKEARPMLWARLGGAYDLADFLTWRATGCGARALCTLAAKWTYLSHADGWQDDFLAAIGLADLRTRAGLPEQALPPGACVGPLAPEAAAELGLPAGIPVASGMIDAFAGALAAIGSPGERALALIAGTSSAVMSVSETPWRAAGIWGPYWGAVLPGRWVNEGGQSATGALLDLVLRSFGPDHSERPDAHAAVEARLRALLAANPRLGAEMSILPDVNGNRTPHGDPALRGVLAGFGLDGGFDGLCMLYWRAAVALAMGLRQILEHMGRHGPALERLRLAGGHVRSPLIMQLYADATGCPVEVVAEGEAVLLGTAISAAVAGGIHGSLEAAARAMARVSTRYHPDAAKRPGYDLDYAVFLAMERHRAELAAIRRMAGL